MPRLNVLDLQRLIRSLPKAMRRNYVPAPDFGRAFFEAFAKPTADDLRGELARFLSRATGVAVSALDFDEAALEPHLRMNLRLVTDPSLKSTKWDLTYLPSEVTKAIEVAYETNPPPAVRGNAPKLPSGASCSWRSGCGDWAWTRMRAWAACR